MKIVAALLVAGFASASPVLARDGGMHGIGGRAFGREMFGGPGMVRGPQANNGIPTLVPAYIIIRVLEDKDSEAYKAAVGSLKSSLAAFGARLAADADSPDSWLGAAAAHIVMIEFDSFDQAQTWKNSDSYKTFRAELERATTVAIELVQGLPTRDGRQARDGRGRVNFDQKAFERIVKKNDQTLSKMKSICGGC